MNSASTLTYDVFFDASTSYGYSLRLEKTPVGIANQLEAMLLQKRTEAIAQPYQPLHLNDVTGTYMSYDLVYSDKVNILTNAQRNITKGIVSIQPEIREYVNANFHDLLWT